MVQLCKRPVPLFAFGEHEYQVTAQSAVILNPPNSIGPNFDCLVIFSLGKVNVAHIVQNDDSIILGALAVFVYRLPVKIQRFSILPQLLVNTAQTDIGPYRPWSLFNCILPQTHVCRPGHIANVGAETKPRNQQRDKADENIIRAGFLAAIIGADPPYRG